jgi:CRISPR/Cas system-associated endonuclease Cas1
MQAMLNYATGVLAGRMTRVVIAKGLDAGFGFLHDGRKPGRLSLVWDCIEPLRPRLVRAVFGYAGGRVFKKGDFEVFEGGVVRFERRDYSGSGSGYASCCINLGVRQSGTMA